MAPRREIIAPPPQRTAADMTPDSAKSHRLIVLFLLGAFLFNYPVLSIFNRPEGIGGIPLLFLYIYAAWAAVIALLWAVTRFSRRGRGPC